VVGSAARNQTCWQDRRPARVVGLTPCQPHWQRRAGDEWLGVVDPVSHCQEVLVVVGSVALVLGCREHRPSDPCQPHWQRRAGDDSHAGAPAMKSSKRPRPRPRQDLGRFQKVGRQGLLRQPQGRVCGESRYDGTSNYVRRGTWQRCGRWDMSIREPRKRDAAPRRAARYHGHRCIWHLVAHR